MDKRLLPAVIGIGFILAITRGWVLFVAVPLWAAATLVLLYIQLGFSQLSSKAKPVLFETLLLYLWSLLYVTMLLCIVAGGDTSGVEAFGFFTVAASSSVERLSTYISLVSGLAFAALAFALIYDLHRLRLRIHPQTVKKRVVFLVSLGVAAGLFTYCAASFIYDNNITSGVSYCNGKAAPANEICGDTLPSNTNGARSGVDIQSIPVR